MNNPMDHKHKQLNIVREKLQSRLAHSYLLRFIDIPVIDEERLYLFHEMLEQTSLEKERKQDTLLSIMLVQIALDTHERISLADVQNEDERKNRQLTVLAGDYFSSMYYHILSKWQDNDLIRTLSGAIQEINESKMSFYHAEEQSVDHIFSNLKDIESILIRKVADHFDLGEWKSFGTQYFYLNRLLFERKQELIQSGTNLLHKIAFSFLSVKESTLTTEQTAKARSVLDSYVDHAKKDIDFLFQQYSDFHRWFHNRHEFYWGLNGVQEKKMAEEG
ncbi:heptaprenyl diphosphate synthase component 1 [Alkalihalobacillus sp. R86527]|uniref:heptaprenyl diphosphate synthase component 1 n=1 Tax=Alkalihalobacillus sp. R86527 TaxID=3093863 RepID=UPI00366F616D